VTTFGNTVSVFDPVSSTIVGAQFAGSEQNHLAISDDSQFLYVSLDGTNSVQRFTLPAIANDVRYGLGSDGIGSYVAFDLQVAPGSAHTTAVILGNLNVDLRAQGGLTIRALTEYRDFINLKTKEQTE
jgi:DNA-binding beta-propeller fold protein YncE